MSKTVPGMNRQTETSVALSRHLPPIAMCLCILLLTACTGSTGRGKPEYANRSPNEVSVVYTGWIVPQGPAESHCQLFGKTASYKGAIRVSELSDKKIHYFDCVYPLSE